MKRSLLIICVLSLIVIVCGCVSNYYTSRSTIQPTNVVSDNPYNIKKIILSGNVTINGEIPKAKVWNSTDYNERCGQPGHMAGGLAGSPNSSLASLFSQRILAMGTIGFLEVKDKTTNTFEYVNTFIGPNGDYKLNITAGDVYPIDVYFFEYSNKTYRYYQLHFKKFITNDNITRHDIDITDP